MRPTTAIKGIWVLILTHGLLFPSSFSQTDSPTTPEWNKLKDQPITEANFRAACDLMQQIGRTDLKQGYAMLAEYVPKVKATGNREWVHVLLMGWAKAKGSTGYFDEAEQLYHEVWKNTIPTERYYRESLVALSLLYAEWGKLDSMNKYVALGEKLCKQANDKENLSFLYGFKAMTSTADTSAMRIYFERAIEIAKDLPDKNALFTARYNYAYAYLQNDLHKQVNEFEELLELSKDSTLNHWPRKLYERTAFTFRNAGPSVYYNLMQINLLLTDYDNAWKFAELFYNATIKPNPNSINAPYFNAEMAIAKAYQEDYTEAKKYFDKSHDQFNLPEDKIPYLSYFIAAGMISEHEQHYDQAVKYYSEALKRGNTQSQHLVPPEIYYAHALIRTGKLNEAGQVLAKFEGLKDVRKYSAIGLNYYKYFAELQKAKGDYAGYTNALEIYYGIKDSLINLSRYRAIKEVEAKVRIRDKEQQITLLNQESAARAEQTRKERLFYIILTGFAGLIIVLLILYLRNRQMRNRQQQALQRSRMQQMEKEHRIEVMQEVMDAEENERRKIADALHDDVNAMLALASLNISSVLEKATKDEPTAKKLQKSHEILTSVTSNIRDLSHRLTPLVIEKYGFRKAIEDLSDAINLSEKIRLETVIVGFGDTQPYSLSFFHELYRIMQELLHNVLKHSKATHALMEIVEHDKQVSILVEDNGVGFSREPSVKGKGLSTIQSRIAYLNGRMEIVQKKNSGTLVVIEIPK